MIGFFLMLRLEPVDAPRHFALTHSRFDAWIHTSIPITEADVDALCDAHGWNAVYVLFHHIEPTLVGNAHIFLGQVQSVQASTAAHFNTPIEIEINAADGPCRLDELDCFHQIRILCNEHTTARELFRTVAGTSWPLNAWRLILADEHGSPLAESHPLAFHLRQISVAFPLPILSFLPSANEDAGLEYFVPPC